MVYRTMVFSIVCSIFWFKRNGCGESDHKEGFVVEEFRRSEGSSSADSGIDHSDEVTF